MIHLVGLFGVICVMLVPRAVDGWRGLVGMGLAVAGVAAVGWVVWAARLPTATDRALVILLGGPVLAAFAMGLVVRAVVVGRGWPIGPDVVVTAGGAAILIVSYLRLFDLI